MGKPLSEEARRKISEAFARRREIKAAQQIPQTQHPGRTLGTIISVKDSDRESQIRMGSLVQQGKARWSHYANDSHHYETMV